jgi:RimJ/RimL family protein N-acetyltransferase
MLWEWANDSETRAASFSTSPIPWGNHVEWFKSKRSDPNCFFYIALDNDKTPVGQVRLDAKENEAVISVSLDPRCRGKGYGSTVIRLASRDVFACSDVTVIHAYIKAGNDASARAFEKAGFRKIGTAIISGHEANDFVLEKDILA